MKPIELGYINDVVAVRVNRSGLVTVCVHLVRDLSERSETDNKC